MMGSFFKWDNSLKVGHFGPVPWVSYLGRFYCIWKILYLICRNLLLFGWISFSIHGSYPLCTEKSLEISWPTSLYVEYPLHKMAFWVNISPHESCLCFLLGWMKMHFWKLKLSHLTWVNEDSLLKAEVVAPYMNEWKCTFESWSCRALHKWMKIRFWKLKLSHLTWVNEDSLLKVEVIGP